MARVSRRGAALRPASRQEEKVWNTAVYARLSIEDGGRKDSDSIEVQAELAAQYIAGRSYLKLTDTYIDNGSTGTNFDRPEFNRLMNDIRSGRINCVVVKDLSRFGRNYVEACELLDKIFPFLRVRFISVNDGYDSETDTGLADSLIVMLKNLSTTLMLRIFPENPYRRVKPSGSAASIPALSPRMVTKNRKRKKANWFPMRKQRR